MSDEYPLMAFIANEGIAPKGERYDRSALVNDTAGKLYKKTVFGDFIYSSNNLETGSIGLNKYGNASISPVYSIFQPTGLADSDFIGRRFVRKDFMHEDRPLGIPCSYYMAICREGYRAFGFDEEKLFEALRYSRKEEVK